VALGAAAAGFHNLRHTCATLFFSRNINQDRLRYARTHHHSHHLDTYSHVLPNIEQNAVRLLEDALK
jgi:integrase